MSRVIAALDGGTSYHHVALNDPRWAHLIDTRVYLPDLGKANLSIFDTIIVTCRCNPDLIIPYKDKFDSFLEQGGTIIAFAQTGLEQWLPKVASREVKANYWWWLEEGADSGLRIAAPGHPLFDVMSLDDMTWHHHSIFSPPPGAESLVDHIEGGSIFYEDKVSTNGRLLISSLDPFFHHGSFFMPATTRFLEKFLPWIKSN